MIPLGFLGAGLWGLWHGLGGSLLALAGLGLRYITTIVRLFGESAWASRAVLTPPPALIVLYYALVFGLAAFFSWRAAGGEGVASQAPTTRMLPATKT